MQIDIDSGPLNKLFPSFALLFTILYTESSFHFAYLPAK